MKAAIIVTPSENNGVIRSLIAAAKSVTARIDIWNLNDTMEAACPCPVDRVIWLRAEKSPNTAHECIPVLETLCVEEKPDLILCAHSVMGKEIAALLGCGENMTHAPEITALSPQEEGLRIRRRVFGYQMEGDFFCARPPYVFSVESAGFSPDTEQGAPEIIEKNVTWAKPDWYTDYAETEETTQQGLEDREIVVIGGRGLHSKAVSEKLETLANLLGAGIGATRPVAWNAWMPMHRIVGLSGALVHPRICLVFGASGCTPFMKGVERSENLIAINRDPDAPIGRQCDALLIGDCESALDSILRRLRERGN